MATRTNPTFSICIPTYEMHGQGAQYLAELFESLKRQTYQDFEVVVSDHSQDDAIEHLCDTWSHTFPITYLRYVEHRGNSSFNTNNALQHATGDVIKIIHQDDLLYTDDALEKIQTALSAHPDAAWGATGFIHTNAEGSVFERPRVPFYNDRMIEANNTMGPPSVSFFKNGEGIFLDEFLIWMNDCELFYRLHAAFGPPLIISDILVAIRIWPSQVSYTLATKRLRENEIRYSLKKNHLSKPMLQVAYWRKKIVNKLTWLYRRLVVDTAFGLTNFIAYKTGTQDFLSYLANIYHSDKGTRRCYAKEGPRHFYAPVYDHYFKKLRNKAINFLEIGIGSGPSLKIWYRYFTRAKIYALDIDDFSRLNNDRVTCLQGDQSNRDDLKKAAEQIRGGLDIIIDDGGHYMNQQQISFGFLFKYLKPGGLYIIEDLHTSYWPINGHTAVYNDIPIDIDADRGNTTLKMINDYIQNKTLASTYLTAEELAYLNEHIADCTLHDTATNHYGPNHLAVFTKK